MHCSILCTEQGPQGCTLPPTMPAIRILQLGWALQKQSSFWNEGITTKLFIMQAVTVAIRLAPRHLPPRYQKQNTAAAGLQCCHAPWPWCIGRQASQEL